MSSSVTPNVLTLTVTTLPACELVTGQRRFHDDLMAGVLQAGQCVAQ